MKSICIVPFTSKEFSMAASLEKDYCIKSVVSPNGFGINGKDIGIIKNRDHLGIRSNRDIEAGIENCEAVLIADCIPNLREFALKAMEIAIDKRKEILCFMNLSKEERNHYTARCFEEKITFTMYEIQDISCMDSNVDQYKILNVPAIYIAEIVDQVDGQEIYYKALNYFRSKNYNVLGLSEEAYSYMFGQVPIKFLSDIDPEKAVLNLNSYVSRQIEKSIPDVIIVKLPKPALKFSNLIHFDFGITAYMAANAIPAEYCLLCSPTGLLTPELIEALQDRFMDRFGVEISGIHIGNLIVDHSYEDTGGLFENSYDKIGNSIAFASELRKYGYQSENYTVQAHLYEFLDAVSSEIFELSYGVI